MTKVFPKEVLRDLACDEQPEGYKKVQDKVYDNSRWSIQHEMIFQTPDGKYYRSYYQVGATENQDESPYEYDGDEIECDEVHQVEKTIKVWKKV